LDFPGYPSRRDHPAFPRAASPPGPRLRQCVHIMTTIIGYRSGRDLSSEKCKRNRQAGADPDFWGLRCPEGTRSEGRSEGPLPLTAASPLYCAALCRSTIAPTVRVNCNS
jgi:hypothetical protein